MSEEQTACELSSKKCVPCEGGIPSFNLSEIHKYLKKVDGWDVKKNENEKYKKYENLLKLFDKAEIINELGN